MDNLNITTQTTTHWHQESWRERMSSVYSILDSKIEFIEKKAQDMVSNISVDASLGRSVSDNEPALGAGLADSQLEAINYDHLFKEFEDLSHSIYVLCSLKRVLNRENMDKVLELITNDSYRALDLEALNRHLKALEE